MSMTRICLIGLFYGIALQSLTPVFSREWFGFTFLGAAVMLAVLSLCEAIENTKQP